MLIQANASAAVPLRATESMSPYAAITAGAIGSPARKASTDMVGSDVASNGSARPMTRRNVEIRSSRSGGPVARAPAISPPTRLPPAKSASGMLPSSAPPWPSAKAGIPTSVPPNPSPMQAASRMIVRTPGDSRAPRMDRT